MEKQKNTLIVCSIIVSMIFLSLLPQAMDKAAAKTSLAQDVRGLIDDPALIGYWTLDEASGNALDSSESQADMVPTGGIQYAQAGQVGNAMGFDGSSAYLTSDSDVMNVRGSLSVGGWVYIAADDASGLQRIILGNGDWNGHTAGMALALEGDDSASLWLRTTQSVEPWMYRAQGSPLTREQWHFITGVYDGDVGTMKLFVDGALQTTTPITPTRVDPTSVNSLQMGATPGLYGSAFFKGRLDEIFYLGRALSDSEVAQIYGGTFTPSPIVVPPWHTKFSLSPMGARLQTLAGTSLRNAGYQYWERGTHDPARSLLDPGNELRQAMVTLLNQADSMSDAAFEAALDNTAMILWRYGDYPLVSQGSLPQSLADVSALAFNVAQDEIEARGLYVANLYDQALRVQVTPTGFPLAVQDHITVSVVGPESSSEALLSFVRPLDMGNVAEIPALQSRQLWIEVDTTGLSAGTYTGNLTLTPEAYGDGFQAPSKQVAVEVTVYGIALEAQPPFDNYTYNYGGSDHADHQARNRVNWLSMSEPGVTSFDRTAQTITLDFTPTDGSVADAQRNNMKLLSIYGFLFKLNEDHGISWNNTSDQALILSYFTQWVDHLENDLGLTSDDYAIYLWDEPEGWGVTSLVADVCTQLRALRPNTRLANTVSNTDAEALSDCLDIFIAGRDTPELNSTVLAFYQNLQAQGKTIWTYDNKAGDPNNPDNGNAPMISPVDLYRYRPWKTVWDMAFDGVSFWSSWYAHETNGTNPAKGFYAWREGLEDTEWILRLQARVDYLLGQPGYDGIPYAYIEAAQAILDEANQDPYFTCNYTADTFTSENKLNDLRRRAILALMNLYAPPPQTCYARINDGSTEYDSVQAAVDAAQPGDTVKVAGTCTGVETRGGLPQTVYIDKSLTLQGGYTTTNWATPDPGTYTTTLDAQRQGRVLYVTGEVTVSLESLHITGGDAAGLGGEPWGYDEDSGGGGYVISATFTLSNCTVISNTSTYAGGLLLYQSDALIQNSTFEDNYGPQYGGALFALRQRLHVINSAFLSNHGSGLSLWFHQDLLLRDNVISNNGHLWGGGISIWQSSPAVLENNTITHNTAQRGGGVEALHSSLTFRGNTITDNTATDHGGGLYVGGSHARFENNTISDNQAQGWGGGGLVLGGSDVSLEGDLITHNSANEYGGGVNTYYDSQVTLRNVVVADNSAGVQGSGLYVLGSQVTLQHSTLVSNTGGDGSGIYVTPDGYWASDVVQSAVVTLTNSIISGHSTGIYANTGSEATLDYTLWWNNTANWDGSGSVATTHELTGDPAFVDAANDDYHLAAGSPAIDAGVNAGARRDMDGDTRALGAGYDIGADEYPGVGLDLDYRAAAPAVNPGASLNYTLIVTGAGTGTATNVNLTGALDPAQRASAVSSSLGTCTVTDNAWGGSFTCTPGDLAPGARAEIAITAEVSTTVAAWQSMVNTVTVTADGTTNDATATVLGQTCQASVNGGPAHSTVQTAVDAATPGDVIEVSGVCLGATARAGTSQQIYIDKALTLQGSSSVSATLDALRQGYGLYITGGASVTVQSLRVTGGESLGGNNNGGCVYISAATATLQNLEVDHCRAYGGAGVHVEESTVTLRESRLHNNMCYGMLTLGGGGGLNASKSEIYLYQNDIYQNTTLRQSDGAGLRIFRSTGEIRDNYIHENVSTYQGGGVYWWNNNNDAIFAHNRIYSNTGVMGGGLTAYGATTFEANEIRNNTAYQGGGIHLQGSTPRFVNTLISQNHATDQGSAMSFYNTRAHLIHTTFADNTGASAFYAQPGYVWQGEARFSHVTLTNTIISGHTLGITATAGNTYTLVNTLWWDTATKWAGEGAVLSTGELTGDPVFADSANGDYHLGAGSAAIDQGLATDVTTDIDGDPRLMGSAPDLGMDEFPQALPSCDYFNDFEGTLGAELAPAQSEVTPLGARNFWGQFVNDTATLSLNGCTDHDYVTLDFDLYTIRTWDGNSTSWGPDVLDISLGSGETLLHTTFSVARGYGLGEEQGQAYPGTYPSTYVYPARTGAAENDTLGYQDPYQPLGTFADAVYHISLTFPHTSSDLALNFTGSGLTSLEDESWGIDNLHVTPHSGAPTHFIGLVAFDNNLSAYADELIDRVRIGTLHNRAVRATLLVDRRGDNNTEVLSLANGTLTSASVPGIGAEVDTADGAVLANFLSWARGQYTGHREVVALIGHGAGLTPEVQATLTRLGIQSTFPPLPRGHDFTPVDVTSGSYLSTPELGRALDLATTDGAQPFDLLILDQCFGGNLESLYEIYASAEVFVASPNYAWATFAYDDYLINMMPSATNDDVAQSLVETYSSQLDDAHPHSMFWVRGADVQAIAGAVSTMGQALHTALVEPSTESKVMAATLASRFVDTTLCTGDLMLCPPDEFVDLASFAQQLQAQFAAGSVVHTAAGAVQTALDAVHVTGRSGNPWVKPDVTWDIADVGLTLLAPLTPTLSTDVVWRASIYTETTPMTAVWSPQPTRTLTLTQPWTFTRDTRWDDFIAAWYARGGARTPTVGQWCYTMPPLDEDVTTPTLPITLTAEPGWTNIQLAWNPTNLPDVAGYRVLRSPTDAQHLVAVAETATPGYFDANPNLVKGDTYCYQVEALWPGGAAAARSNIVCTDLGQLALWVPNVWAAPGETAIIPINIRNADGLRLAATDIWLDFDSTVIEPLTISATALTSDYSWTYALTSTESYSRAKIAALASPPPQLYGDGSLFWLTVRVRGNTGTMSPLNLREFVDGVGGSTIYTPEDPYQPVPLVLEDGIFHVGAAYTLGDVNGNGVVEAIDAWLALQIAVGDVTPTWEQRYAGDVNGNDVVDAADATMILYYAAHHQWPAPSTIQRRQRTFAPAAALAVSLTDARGMPGTIIETTLQVENLTGGAGGDFVIAYDPALVDSIASVTASGLGADVPLAFHDDGQGLLHIAMADAEAVSGSGSLVKISLHLALDAPVGRSAPLGLASARLHDTLGRDFTTSALQQPPQLRNALLHIGQVENGAYLSPGGAQDVTPGSIVTFTHILMNTGRSADTFNLEATNAENWPWALSNVTMYPGGTARLPMQLGAGMTATVILSLTVPSDVAPGTTNPVTLTATSTNDPAVFATANTQLNVPDDTPPTRIYLPLVMRAQN